MRTIDRRLAIAAVLGLGLLALLAGLPERSLNTDEVFLPLAARHGDLLGAVTADIHPPAYALLVGAVTAADLPEPFWRLLSALFWLATAYLTYRLGLMLDREKTGVLAMTLLVASPLGFQAGRLVRSYASAALLGAVIFCLVAAHLRKPSRGRALALGVVLALGCYTFYYHLYLLAAIGVLGLCLLRRGHAAGRGIIGAALLAGLLFAPWLPELFGRFGELGGGWVQWSASPLRIVRRVGQIVAAVGGLGGMEPALRAVLPAVAGALATLISLTLALVGTLILWRSTIARVLVGLTALTIGFALGAHYLVGAFVGLPYFLVLAPPLALVVAAPFAVNRARFAIGVVFALVLAVNLLAWPTAARQGDEPLRPASEWIDAHLGDDGLVLGVAWFAVDGYRYYGAGREAVGVPYDLRPGAPVRRVQDGLVAPDDLRRLEKRLVGAGRVALLLTHTTWRGQDRGERAVQDTLRAAGFVRIREQAWPRLISSPTVRAEIWKQAG